MSVRCALLCALTLFPACVGYVADDVELRGIAAEVRRLPGGDFALPDALATAFRDNPELRQLEAKARAAGAVTEAIELQAEYRGADEMLGVMLDPVALLGLGPRGGALAVDDAEAAAAVAELTAARWRISAAVTETFAIDRALATLQLPDPHIAADTFEQAGLASPAAAARLRAAQQRLVAERDERMMEREHNRDTLRRLLGRDAATSIGFVHRPGDDVVQPPAGDDAVLARPDLQLPMAQFRLADAAFRSAVAAQYPSLMLGPEIPLRGGMLDAMAVLRVPFAMSGRAEAARHRRDAAREALAAAWTDASNGAADAEHERTLAGSMLAATRDGLAASEVALRAARVALDVEVDAFDRFAEAAAMLARDAAEHRAAVVTAVRADVRCAMAYGWPRAATAVEGSR